MPPSQAHQERPGGGRDDNRQLPPQPADEWNQLHDLHAQYPELLKQRAAREQEISSRTTDRQLQATSGLLDAWGLGVSTEPLAPYASLPTPTSSRTEQLPFAPEAYQQQPPGQQWRANGWTYVPDALSGEAGFGTAAFHASGLVGEPPLSPTEVPSSQALPYSSIPSSYPSTYAPYPSTYAPYPPPLGSALPFNPPHPSLALPDQHTLQAIYPAQESQQPSIRPAYARHDSYQLEPTMPPAPTAQHLALHPAFMPSHAYDVQPPSLQQSSPYNPTLSAGAIDPYGRPLLTSAPHWARPSAHSFHAQHSHYQQHQFLPQHQQSFLIANFPPSEPTHVAYESTPSTDASFGTQDHSPQDLGSPDHSRQASFTAESTNFPLPSTSAPIPSTSVALPLPLNSTAVDFAEANRTLLAQPIAAPKRARVSAATGKSGDVGGSRPPSGQLQARVSRKGSKRITADLMATCVNCGDPIARLILRGQPAELDVPHAAVFTCLRCDPSVSPPANTNTQSGGAPLKPTKVTTSFRKRHKRADTGAQTINACDVCLRDIATGSVLADDQQTSIDFQIEVVCTRCDDQYRRCSDCGGGGGARLGVGKWRSKELFTNGRKTCSLSHLRLGALSDMFYDVHSVTEIPRNEVKEVADICQGIFSNTMFSGICIPEVFEQQSAVVKSFAEVSVWAARGWSAIEPMIKVDIEKERNIRRYLALRSCTPNPRKGSQPVDLPPADPSRVILRPNKDIVGFIIAEWDTLVGSLFLAVVVPWAMGEVFDATTILIQALFQRVEDDRRLLNADRVAMGLAEFPVLDIVWTMMFFEKEARMIAHLEKKRGFSHLDTFLQANPSIDPAQFPPLRPCYLPVERQRGWSVMIRRRQGSGEDDFFAIRRTSASEDVERKKKEQKAKARREGEMGNHRG